MSKKTSHYRIRQRRHPGKVIAVMNHKGGTAKSTSVELLALLRAKETKVPPLLVDFDSQMNLSSALRYDENRFPGNIGNALWDPTREWGPDQIETNICGIKYRGLATPVHLVPGTLHLDDPMAALESKNRRSGDVVMRLRKALHHVRDFYDYIYIDTSPAVGALPGDLALFAADVLLIPVGGLRSVLGLVEVLTRVERHAEERRRQRMPELQVIIYAPHVLTDKSAEKYGEYEVRNGDWYPYLCEKFPRHFVRPVVRHSIQLPRAFKEDNSLRALKGARQQEYRALAGQVYDMIEDDDLPRLSTLLAKGAVDLQQVRDRVNSMIVESDRAHEIKSVKFMRAVSNG